MPTVKVNGQDHHYDPSRVEARTMDLVEDYAPKYILVYLKDSASLRRLQKDQLKALGVEPQEYLDPDTYICAYNGSDLPSIAQLDFVEYVEEYPKDKVVQPSLYGREAESHTIDVTLHNDVKSDSTLKESIAEAAKVDVDEIEVCTLKFDANIVKRMLRVAIGRWRQGQVDCAERRSSIHCQHRRCPLYPGDS